MKANVKHIILAGVLAISAIVSGCVTLSTEGNGSDERPEILSLIEQSSQGK